MTTDKMKIPLQDIVSSVGGEIVGDLAEQVVGVAKIETAGPGELTFLANAKYQKYLESTHASVIVVPRDTPDMPGKTLIRTDDPYFTFMRIVRMFNPEEPLIDPGVHPSAIVHESSSLESDVRLGAYVVVGKNCKIGCRSILMPGVIIGNGAVIGEDCVLHAHVSIRENVILGNRVVIHDGTVVGSDGFGFAPHAGSFHKIPQVGTVVIEDDVEIGANTTIDRATLGETIIRQGTKLDNLIQVAHNCQIGEHTVIAAQAGLSGSTKIGKYVRVGGQAGFAGHLEVADGAAVGAQAGVTKSISSGQVVFGTPANPVKEEFRLHAMIKRLPELIQDIKALKKKIELLEGRKHLDD